jgi:hypothetical protein
MQSSRTANAITAAGMTGPGRQTRFALDIVETHREGRWFCIDVRGECKSAQCDQEGLRSNGIGDEDTDKRSPGPLGPHAKFEHVAVRQRPRIMRTVKPKVNSRCCGKVRMT